MLPNLSKPASAGNGWRGGGRGNTPLHGVGREDWIPITLFLRNRVRLQRGDLPREGRIASLAEDGQRFKFYR
jgi:hypothetical protein